MPLQRASHLYPSSYLWRMLFTWVHTDTPPERAALHTQNTATNTTTVAPMIGWNVFLINGFRHMREHEASPPMSSPTLLTRASPSGRRQRTGWPTGAPPGRSGWFHLLRYDTTTHTPGLNLWCVSWDGRRQRDSSDVCHWNQPVKLTTSWYVITSVSSNTELISKRVNLRLVWCGEMGKFRKYPKECVIESNATSKLYDTEGK